MTQTYYQTNTTDSTTWSFSGGTNAGHWLLSTTTAATGTVTFDIALSGSGVFHFLTAAGEPNSADWPNGTFNVQANISAIGADISVSSVNFCRVNAAGTTASETGSAGVAWTTTGLQTGNVTRDFAAGLASDRYGVEFVAANASSMKAETLTFNVNTSERFADGPWTAAAFDAALTAAYDTQGIPAMTPRGWKAIGYNQGG